MNFDQLLSRLMADTTGTASVAGSLGLFAPELVVCATLVALLLARLLGVDRRIPSYWVALIGSLVGFWFAYCQFTYLEFGGAELGGPFAGLMNWFFNVMGLPADPAGAVGPFFTGLLVFDDFTVFFRVFLLLFLVLVIALTVLSGIPDNEDGPDFYTLLLGSSVGMMLMASAHHLLILFLGVEMASVPSYAMVGFQKGRKASSEAALKFVIYGAGAAGVMLYGISLLAGLLGTANLPQIADRLSLLLVAGEGIGDPMARTVILAAMMVFIGLAFKLSLVPFHFWCPDAFHGAPAEVAGYLSVASKAAAFALLTRFALAFTPAGSEAMANVNVYLGVALGIVAVVTTTFGNLAAYAQTNLKRLLAYSTIAHAGYMLLAVAALVVILNAPAPEDFDRGAEATRAIGGLLFYLTVYLFMNLGAFAVVALIRNRIFSEEIEDYNGIGLQVPLLGVGMAVCLFSLVGLPPTGGFFGKWYIFAALFEAGWLHWSMWAFLVIAGLNTVFSLFYYIRIMKAMFIAPRPEFARRADTPAPSVATFYVVMVSVPVILFGIYGPLVDGLSRKARDVAAGLFVGPEDTAVGRTHTMDQSTAKVGDVWQPTRTTQR